MSQLGGKFTVYIQSSQFGFCCQGHDIVYYLCCVVENTIVLGGGGVGGYDKMSPCLLLALGSLRYDASLWTTMIISLAWYIVIALGFAAAHFKICLVFIKGLEHGAVNSLCIE